MMSNDIRYLNPVAIEITKSKYCRFKKSGIKFLDYKDANYLLKLVNEQGKILPRRLTGTSAKFQGRVNKAIKRARHLALMPYVGDMLK
ncbi:MAG: 30S ribosomal protein S18 [Bacteroidetes bacterium]|nr:30S ribosomal protein S18 [Bacteroidota bacterium]MBM3424272.1 30S ribosomal protein S18 [Bacteroidota bacterium]